MLPVLRLSRLARRLLAVTAVALLAAAGATMASDLGGPGGHGAANPGRVIVQPTVLPTMCTTVIGAPATGTQSGYRVALGVVSAPPAYIPQVVSSGNRSWPFWRKVGLVIHGGSPPVTVSVPADWRGREQITWGPYGMVSSLRIPSCPGTWDAYAGGFYLRTPTACVPLRFQVERRTATVWFGLGRHCPAGLT